MKGIFNRSELLLGKEAMQKVCEKRVIVFGVGGVGSWCAEGLIRSGISHLTIVDSDRVSVSNINRQLMATTKTVGQVKVSALRSRLLEINPSADILAIEAVYCAETSASFHLEDYDYIIDCIDSLQDKIHLLLTASRQPRAVVYSSMGAALKMDPTRIRVAEFWKVTGCPLARAIRQRLKREKLYLSKKVQCVYSEELLANKGMLDGSCDGLEEEPSASYALAKKAQINGSVVHITAIYGFTIAGLVMKDIAKV